MMNTYNIEIAGLSRCLPIRAVSASTSIAFLQLLGDVELAERAAAALAEKANSSCDLLVAMEAKAVPLAHEMSRLLHKPYLVLRKAVKPYLDRSMAEPVRAFTSAATEQLWLDPIDAPRLEGASVWLVDDVITTGNTMRAAQGLVERYGGKVIERLAILAEGDDPGDAAATTLGHLPLFDAAQTATHASSSEGFWHGALGLQHHWNIAYTALSKHSFCYRVFITKFVLEREFVPLNPAMNFDFAFHGLAAKNQVITANNNMVRSADEVWVFGPISDGVWAEVLIGERLGKPIRFHRINKDFSIDEIPVEECEFEADVAAYAPRRATG